MIIQLSIFSIFPMFSIILVIISTLYSLKYQSPSQLKNNNFHEIMKSFSLLESNKRLFSPSKDRIFIVDLFMLLIIFSVCLTLVYDITVSLGALMGYNKIFSSFALDFLAGTDYFILRALFPLLKSTLFMLR